MSPSAAAAARTDSRKSGMSSGLLQATGVEIVSPTKRSDQALTGEAVEFEGRELQRFHFLNKPPLFGTADEFRLVAETRWKAQGAFEQLGVRLRHILFA